MPTVQVPTINDNPRDFDKLFSLWAELNDDRLHVRFEFSMCRFLRQNAVAFLGGLMRLIEYRGGHVEFQWNTVAGDVAANLAQNGFMEVLGGPGHRRQGNSIPFREDSSADPHDFQNYLSELWLGRGWVNVSPALRDAIVGRLAEIYLNAFDHARSPIGVFSCGQHFPRNRELNLTIVDFGVGIPSNVRLFYADRLMPEEIPAPNCMRWAFQAGTSTKPGGRGNGLDLLQAFVRKNRGRVEIFSHEGYAVICDGRISFAERPIFFEGTLVNISLTCDESYYCLTSELSSASPF